MAQWLNRCHNELHSFKFRLLLLLLPLPLLLLLLQDQKDWIEPYHCSQRQEKDKDPSKLALFYCILFLFLHQCSLRSINHRRRRRRRFLRRCRFRRCRLLDNRLLFPFSASVLLLVVSESYFHGKWAHWFFILSFFFLHSSLSRSLSTNLFRPPFSPPSPPPLRRQTTHTHTHTELCRSSVFFYSRLYFKMSKLP